MPRRDVVPQAPHFPQPDVLHKLHAYHRRRHGVQKEVRARPRRRVERLSCAVPHRREQKLPFRARNGAPFLPVYARHRRKRPLLRRRFSFIARDIAATSLLRPLRGLFIARDAAAASLLNPLRALLSPAAMLRQIHTHCSAIHKKTVVLCEPGSSPIQPRCDVR